MQNPVVVPEQDDLFKPRLRFSGGTGLETQPPHQLLKGRQARIKWQSLWPSVSAQLVGWIARLGTWGPLAATVPNRPTDAVIAPTTSRLTGDIETGSL